MKQHRFPDILIGALLAVAIFAMGALTSSQYGEFANYIRKQGTEQRAEQVKNDNAERGFLEWLLTDQPSGVFGAIMAFIAGGQLWLFIVQLKLIRKSLDQAAAAANAAGIAAAAAKESADHIPRVERAYVFAGPSNINYQVPAFICTFDILADNCGKTPGIITEAAVGITDNRPLGTPDYSACQIRLFDNIMDAGRVGQRLPIDCSHKTVKPFFVYGYVKYKDIFRKEHTSRFCSEILPAQRGWELAGTPAWNDWD